MLLQHEIQKHIHQTCKCVCLQEKSHKRSQKERVVNAVRRRRRRRRGRGHGRGRSPPPPPPPLLLLLLHIQTNKQASKQTNKQTNRAKQRKYEFGDATRRVLGLGLSTKTLHCKAKRKATCRATEEGRSASTTATARRRRQRRENVCAWVCVRRSDYAIMCVFSLLYYIQRVSTFSAPPAPSFGWLIYTVIYSLVLATVKFERSNRHHI